jgi:Uma2 family endonuclease
MSEPLRSRKLSIQEYLSSEKTSQIRHEYMRGEIFAMNGASAAHVRICVNLSTALDSFLDGSRCSVYVNNMKVFIEKAESYYYPDVVVSCEPFNPSCYVLNEPVVIVEVLSPSTKQIDLREKLAVYKDIPELKQYIIVHQNRMKIEVHQRLSEDEWEHFTLHPNGVLEFQCCPGKILKLPIERVYKGIDLPPVVREEEEEYSFS